MIWMEHYVTTNMVRRKAVQVNELLTIAARCHLSDVSKSANHFAFRARGLPLFSPFFGSGSQQGFGLLS